VRTHGFADIEAARLRGYRRVWQPSPARGVAFLTVVADAAGHVLGALAPVPGGDWQALDLRERAYARAAVPHHDIDGRHGVNVYAVGSVARPRPEKPILLSYLDVVIQGFLQIHGAEGAQDFFRSTGGWETPVLDDRAAPRYPRHQALAADERRAVDTGLASVGARIVAAGASRESALF